MAEALTSAAPATPPSPTAGGLAATTLAALAGGAALGGLGVPAGWLSGAMLGVAGAAAAGLAQAPPKPVQQLTIVLSGVAMGSGLTPATLHTLARYPLSLAILALAIAVMTAASYAALLRAGFERATAFYGAVPGALSYVFLVARHSQADLARVAVIQVFRLFVLMAVVPLAARVGGGAVATGFATDPLAVTALLVALSLGAGFAFETAGLANGGLYAGILVSCVAHGSGWAPGRLEPSLQIVAQTLVGAWVGARFIGFDWRLMRRLLIAALASFGAAFVAAAVFAGVAAEVSGAPFADALAAFAPGGLEAMTMMAFALGLDPLYVGAHHLARFLFISASLPFLAGKFAR